MNEFMKILLSLSTSGALLLLFILGLKQIYKNKFSKRWQYYIWIIVVMRFLIPFTSDTMNIRILFEMFHTTVITNESPVSPNVPVTINTNNNEPKQLQLPSDENEMVNITTQKPLSIYVYLFFAWSALALVLFVRKITIYQGFIQYIKAGNTEVSDIKNLNLLSDCEEKLNIKARVELYHNTLIASPIMIGFFRPSIILPVGELKDKELFYIFMHELHHYKQRDMFYKWLVQIVICIHWFNPFVYLLEKEVNKVCELSCDEAVISGLDDKAKREYGDTLIYFLKSNNPYKNSLASVTLTEEVEQLKERLGVIMYFKRKSKIIRFLTGILTLCIIFWAAFVGVYPVAAANHLDPADINKFPISEKENHKADTYIYDDLGWNLDKDNAWDNGWNHVDWNHESWDLEDKALIETYAAHGIEKKGMLYYYHDELVYILKNQYPNSSSSNINTDLKGAVSIKVTWNTEGEITDISYMTEEEIEKLLKKAMGGTEEIPVINTREWDSSEFLAMKAYYETDRIYILPSTTNKVVLKEYLTEDKSDYYASTEIKNDVLTICAGSRPTGTYNSYIELYVPNRIFDNIKVETVSGTITVKNYTGVVALSTISGRINIFDSNIAGNVNTVSGSIGLYPSEMLGDLYVNSHSGEISAIFPTSISYNIKAETTAGKIKGSYFNTQSKEEKEISRIVGSNPKLTVTLKTISANIEIN